LLKPICVPVFQLLFCAIHEGKSLKRRAIEEQIMSYHYYDLGYKPIGSTWSEHYLQYAEVYKDAIQVLLQEYMERPPAHDYSLAPILFLLRQYIELQLKGIIMYNEYSHEVITKHDIVYLYERALETIKERYGLDELGQPNEDTVKFIYSLREFDEKGQAFRYPETSDGNEFFDESTVIDPWLDGKITSLPELNTVAEKVIRDLEGIEGYLDLKRENEQEYFAAQE